MRWIALTLLMAISANCFAEEPAVSADSIPPSPDRPAIQKVTLDDCVAMALSTHPRLAEANAKVTESHGTAVQAGLYPNPRIDSGNPQTIGPSRTSVYSIGMTQEIVRGGKLQLDRSAALEAARQSEWETVLKRFEVLTNVRQEFFSMVAAQRRQTLTERLLDLAKRSEKASENLLGAGQVAEIDVLLLRVERRKAETALQEAQIALLGQRRQLASTIGVPVDFIGEADGALTAAVPEFDDDEVLAQVMSSSPIVQIANLDVSRTILLLRRAEVEPIKNLTIQGGTQYSDATANYQALVGLYIDVPLYDRNQGNIMAAQASVQRSMAARMATQQELTKQLAAAVTRFHIAEKTVANYEQGILPDARRTLELVQEAYKQSQFDITRVLQTQRTFFEANIDYISALESRLNAAAEVAGLLQLDQFP